MKETVLVTGASRGIGKAIALEFAKSGYDLVIACKSNIGLLNEVRAEILSYSVNCYCFQGDLCNEKTISDLDNFFKEHCISIDILINNAGISYLGLLQDMTIHDWKMVIDTNLTSVFLLSRYVLENMLKQKKGKIINISSVWGNVGASYEVAYSTSKGALNSFTKSLAKELAPSNIQVNAIACGAMDTQMNDDFSYDEIKLLEDSIPTGRLGTPQEAADFVLKIAQSGTYLTGQIISLDGGWI